MNVPFALDRVAREEIVEDRLRRGAPQRICFALNSLGLWVGSVPLPAKRARPPMLTQALLVDDSRSVLNFLKRHIEAEGLVEATTFLDPVEALTCARERIFDLVLVDYEMPHMDGISFIRVFRTLPGCADIPIAMMTSRQTDDVKMEALQAGATDFLPKQPQSVEMAVLLRNLIQLGAAVRKLNDRAAHLASEVAAATRKLGEREEEIILRLALAVEIPRQRHRRAHAAGRRRRVRRPDDAAPLQGADAARGARLIEHQGRQFDPACVEAFLSRWDEVIEIAAGQQATPFQKTDTALVPDMGSAASSHPAGPVPTA
jgi:CheY-like chemotaxis protein